MDRRVVLLSMAIGVARPGAAQVTTGQSTTRAPAPTRASHGWRPPPSTSRTLAKYGVAVFDPDGGAGPGLRGDEMRCRGVRPVALRSADSFTDLRETAGRS
jgi:hypothetical protein